MPAWHAPSCAFGIEDAVNGDQVVQTLVADDLEPRRMFIVTNAKLVSNLDS